MKRRKTILLKDKKYPCIEILYRDRNIMPKRESVCIACYVTLPKKYHKVDVDFSDPHHFSHRYFQTIVYSFLVIPVCCETEGIFIKKLLERCKDLDVL